jgi:hypothetical protein
MTDKETQNAQTQIAGALLSDWLPSGIMRRMIMFILLLIGLYGFLSEGGYLMFSWLLLPLFSPRCVGEIAYAIGKFSK